MAKKSRTGPTSIVGKASRLRKLFCLGAAYFGRSRRIK